MMDSAIPRDRRKEWAESGLNVGGPASGLRRVRSHIEMFPANTSPQTSDTLLETEKTCFFIWLMKAKNK